MIILQDNKIGREPSRSHRDYKEENRGGLKIGEKQIVEVETDTSASEGGDSSRNHNQQLSSWR